MWRQDEGYFVASRHELVKGPNLQRLIASQNAFIAGDRLELEFTTKQESYRDRPHKMCVASIYPVNAERVHLELRDGPNGRDYSYERVYNYDIKRYEGMIEKFRKDEVGPIGYNPTRLPHVDELDGLTDSEFILVYGLQMMTYQFVDRYDFPIRCGNPGCKFIIDHALDLRKSSGQCLCPSCFAKMVAEPGANKHHQRIARLLPNRPIAIPFFPDGGIDRELWEVA